MGKKKKTEQTGTTSSSQFGTGSTQNQFGYMTPTDTPDIQAMREWQPQVDPGISYSFGRARQALKNQFANPLGADAPAAVRDAAIYAGEGDIAQQEAQAYRGAYNDQNQQEYQKRAFLSQLTRPELVGTGSTSTTSGSASGRSAETKIEPGSNPFLQGLAGVGMAFA